MGDDEIEVEGRDNGFDRLVNFSDGVIAIAITLLALDIQLPPHPDNLDAAGLYRALLATAPKVWGYAVSFLMVGQFWYAHHHKFRFIRGFDGKLIFINLLFLMAICFVPFACQILSEYRNATAFIFYSLNMVLASLLSAALWAYVLAHPALMAPSVDAATRRHSLVQPLRMAGVFAAAALVSFYDIGIAQVAWLLLIPAVGGRSRKRGAADAR